MITWKKMAVWQRRVTVTAAMIAAIILLTNWGVQGHDAVHWQYEADALEMQIAQTHNADVQGVYQMLAEEKRADRVQRNAREYARLKLAYENENWKTQGGKDLMLRQISSLELAICADASEQEKAVDPVISTIICVN